MKKITYLATGVLIGAILTTATPTLAATVKTIQAKVNSTVSVLINGKKANLASQPIEYNGLNYLPVGEIGRSLGLGVSYDKGTNSIRIQGNENTNAPTGQTSASNNNENPIGNSGTTAEIPSQTNLPKIIKDKTLKIGETLDENGIKLKIYDLKTESVPNSPDSVYYGFSYDISDDIKTESNVKAYVHFTDNTFNMLYDDQKIKLTSSDTKSISFINKGSFTSKDKTPDYISFTLLIDGFIRVQNVKWSL